MIKFEIHESEIIKGVWIIKPSVFEDERGDIWTSFISEEIEPEGLRFTHDKFSESRNNVLRGIHWDNKTWKLVTCVSGKIQQVVVDMRTDSPTYLQWQDFIIGDENKSLILLPPNVGNGYYVMSDKAIYHYKLAYKGDYVDADEQFSIGWNDESIGVKWLADAPILSNRDTNHET